MEKGDKDKEKALLDRIGCSIRKRPELALGDYTWSLAIGGKYEPPALQDDKLPFTMEALIARFANTSPLAKAMCLMETIIRQHADNTKSPISGAAKLIMNTFSAVAQLVGWQHVQHYVNDPAAYMRLHHPSPDDDKTTTTAFKAIHLLEREDLIAPLQDLGKNLLSDVALRVNWLFQLKGSDDDMQKIVFYLAGDEHWLQRAQNFLKEAEYRIEGMLKRHARRFAEFQDLQNKKGVTFPHGLEARQAIEAAGWHFKPMIIKRDRFVCEVCGVEVSGWRAYHNPWRFHNYGRHPPSFRPPPP